MVYEKEKEEEKKENKVLILVLMADGLWARLSSYEQSREES